MQSPLNSNSDTTNDGPSNKDILEWKDKYRSVYRVVILDHECYYRKLRIIEYVRIEGASLTDLQYEEAVVRGVLLYPGFDTLYGSYAGVISTLSTCILRSSCLELSAEDLKEEVPLADAWARGIDEEKRKILPRTDPVSGQLVIDKPIIPLILNIIQVIPSYRPEELLMMTMDQILERVAWAQYMTGDIPSDVKKLIRAYYGPGSTIHSTAPSPNPSTNQPTYPSSGRGQWSLSQQELEQMSADASTKALSEEMRKHMRNRTMKKGNTRRKDAGPIPWRR